MYAASEVLRKSSIQASICSFQRSSFSSPNCKPSKLQTARQEEKHFLFGSPTQHQQQNSRLQHRHKVICMIASIVKSVHLRLFLAWLVSILLCLRHEQLPMISRVTIEVEDLKYRTVWEILFPIPSGVWSVTTTWSHGVFHRNISENPHSLYFFMSLS